MLEPKTQYRFEVVGSDQAGWSIQAVSDRNVSEPLVGVYSTWAAASQAMYRAGQGWTRQHGG